ncbi:hypothetical protein LEP1GSC195_0412 [Leptospira wolbachii serovar Codice str. CDC]|uniref:Uncharacterized protein n=1 Tax=Leptospira wolbachii serovar Codice str. CDC TaxID=1218599 RepID=R9AEC6_9LEPT|nr:hypothetical protein LEP1GSC195_0412 [Leptospira wolbachii serovar Codice str. CDC]
MLKKRREANDPNGNSKILGGFPIVCSILADLTSAIAE